MKRALFGLETETAIIGTAPGNGRPRAQPAEYSRLGNLVGQSIGRVYGRIPGRQYAATSTNVFLVNGARLYLDVGSHPEYATPECSNLRQLIAAAKAGEIVLNRVMDDAAEAFIAAGFSGATLIANNRDRNGVAWGCHENYLIARESGAGSINTTADALLPFFISRQIVCGGGTVIPTATGAQWRISQRYDIFDGAPIGSNTTSHRSIFNTRDEPHANADKWRRLHVIVGDTNMSEWTTFLKVGSTQLVLDMIADGVEFSDQSIADPTAALSTFASDITCSAKVELSNGASADAPAIQRRYLEAAEAHFADHESSLGADDTAEVLAMWRLAIDALETHDMPTIVERLGARVDWVIKYQMIEAYRQRHDIALDSPRVSQIDIAYHGIDPATGLYNVLLRRDAADSAKATEAGQTPPGPRIERMVSDADVAALLDAAPATTRAHLRGRYIAAARAHGLDPVINWAEFSARRDTVSLATVKCGDPLANHDPRVDEAIRTLARVGRISPSRPSTPQGEVPEIMM